MTKFRKCTDCGAPVGKPEHFVRFKMAKVGQTERGKVKVCLACYNGWKDHEKECTNPPNQCFTIVKESNNILTILDARPDAYDYLKRRNVWIPY